MGVEMEIGIYVACLAAYNNGILHGAWIDALQEVAGIREDVAHMLAASPIAKAEEYAIHDYEGFEGASISEYEGLPEVAAKAAFIAEHGQLGVGLLDHYGDRDDARTAMDEYYQGEFTSLADFAQAMTGEAGEVPEHLAPYIYYERMGRDLEISDVFVIETGFQQVHVFWSH